jgi:hypothetical protein
MQYGHIGVSHFGKLWTSPVSDPNETSHELKLEKYPDKTVMGRTEKGFDFLGISFQP